ncbi:MAG TPA: exodeoxyribonuclease VII small subunit [Lentimicrobium sp.]|jgi:exodeoxyribonuclease VII small subunit|nr:exodeoxyribonuclease VII small subunit [Lentimicrobium sp.]
MNDQKEDMTYTGAITELEQIINEMEDASISMDELSSKVKRAAVLLQFCKDKLTSTEHEVNLVLKSFEGEA